MSNREAFFENKEDIIRKHGDVIDLPGMGHGRIISFSSIMRTGQIPQYNTFSTGNLLIGNMSIDLNQNDIVIPNRIRTI